MNLAESFAQLYGRWRQLALHWRLAGLLPLLAIVIGLATIAGVDRSLILSSPATDRSSKRSTPLAS